ncbi:MAG: hypothetical protein NTW87_31585 [Planctomycetota bacterium]|nr:hypothetical protein [Planctomycetota bacterium]
MARKSSILASSKTESTLLVLFIPSVDRDGKLCKQETWKNSALILLGELFGGATAFARGEGVWRDDERGQKLVFDQPYIIHCYTNDRDLRQKASDLRAFLVRMGKATNQGAVGLVIDRDYCEIRMSGENSNE